MKLNPNGTTVFVFSDPGGAKPCLSLIELNKLTNVVVVSDRKYSFYKDFNVRVRFLNKGFEKFIDEVQPKLIFTGTSYTSNIEKEFISIAKIKNIPCYSFVDHWTRISDRFKYRNGKTTLPDKIWVIDERAKQIAIEENIEENKIVVSGNPYHSWLKNWKPNISLEDFYREIKLEDKGRKLLVYAPDPLSNIEGFEKFGFDELAATSFLVKLFSENSSDLRDWLVLVKPHPNQDTEKLSKIINQHDMFYMLPGNMNVNLIIYYSDLVMGFFSSFLIEADVMGKPVLRFLDKEIKFDPIAELRIGRIVSPEELLLELAQ